MRQHHDRIGETSTTTGTVPFVLAGAISGHRTFGSVSADGEKRVYQADDENGNWEVGLGTYNASANTFRAASNADVWASSNGGNLVDFPSGIKHIVHGQSAEEVPFVRNPGDPRWQVPEADGNDNQVLATDGSGQLKWVDPTSLDQLVNNAGELSGTVEIDLSAGTHITGLITDPITLSFTGLPPAGQVREFSLTLIGNEEITWPEGTEFAGGEPPLIAGLKYRIDCVIDAGGLLTVLALHDLITEHNWLDTTHGVTVDGGVESVDLKAGILTPLTQSTADFRPALLADATPSGQPALSFDGVDDWISFDEAEIDLLFDVFGGTTDTISYGVIVPVRVTGSEEFQTFFSVGRLNTTNRQLRIEKQGGAWGARKQDALADFFNVTGGAFTSDWTILSLLVGGGAMQLRQNGSVIASHTMDPGVWGAPGPGTPYGITLGVLRRSTLVRFAECQIGRDFMVLNNPTERAFLEAEKFVAARAGITLGS